MNAGDLIKVDICVIGGGAGGLSVAAGAAQLGSSTVLIEKGVMGGDCLNYGCVPSKALLAAGHAAHAVRQAPAFGVNVGAPEISAAAVYDHVHATIAAIAPHDSVERFEGLGVRVIAGEARFSGPREVVAGDVTIRARRFVIATGSSPFVPPIAGLDQVSYATNETIFTGPDLPKHLIIIGGGPIGIELAQAHRQLGAKVSVLEMAKIMPGDDPELVQVVAGQLAKDGVDIYQGADISGVEKTADGCAVLFRHDGGDVRVEGSHLLIATGRRANVANLGLDAAGIEFSAQGIKVDAHMKTTNRKVFAIGDVAGGPQFTHVAGDHAGIVIRNALFRLPAKANMRAVPRVTYTAPELAQVGLTEDQARQRHGDIRVLRGAFDGNHRARAELQTDGMIKVVTTKKGHILGAGIVGPHAGELIQIWVLALSKKMKVKDIASMIAPYPTLGEISKQAAGSFYTPSLFSERTRKIVRFLRIFG